MTTKNPQGGMTTDNDFIEAALKGKGTQHKCGTCQKLGHKTPTCPLRKNKKNEKSPEEDSDTAFRHTQDKFIKMVPADVEENHITVYCNNVGGIGKGTPRGINTKSKLCCTM